MIRLAAEQCIDLFDAPSQAPAPEAAAAVAAAYLAVFARRRPRHRQVLDEVSDAEIPTLDVKREQAAGRHQKAPALLEAQHCAVSHVL